MSPSPPSLQARDRFLVPQPTPSLQTRAGWGFVLSHAAKATPSLAPNASGGVCSPPPQIQWPSPKWAMGVKEHVERGPWNGVRKSERRDGEGEGEEVG